MAPNSQQLQLMAKARRRRAEAENDNAPATFAPTLDVQSQTGWKPNQVVADVTARMDPKPFKLPTAEQVGADVKKGGINALAHVERGLVGAAESTLNTPVDFAQSLAVPYAMGGNPEVSAMISEAGPPADVAASLPERFSKVYNEGGYAEKQAKLNAAPRFDFSGAKLTVPEDQQSVTGGLIEGLAQFLAARRVVGRAAPGGGLAPQLGKDAVAVGVGFDGSTGRLADIIDPNAIPEGPLRDYAAWLKTQPEDSPLVGRFKNLLEDLTVSGPLVAPQAAIRGGQAGINALKPKPGAHLPPINATATPSPAPVSSVPPTAPRTPQGGAASAGQQPPLNAVPAAPVLSKGQQRVARDTARILGRVMRSSRVKDADIRGYLPGAIQRFKSLNDERVPFAFFLESDLPQHFPGPIADEVTTKLRTWGRERNAATGPQDTSRKTTQETVKALRGSQEGFLTEQAEANMFKGSLIGREDQITKSLRETGKKGYEPVLAYARDVMQGKRIPTPDERQGIEDLRAVLARPVFRDRIPNDVKMTAEADASIGDLQQLIEQDPVTAAHWLQSNLRKLEDAAEDIGGKATPASLAYGRMRTDVLEPLKKAAPGYDGALKRYGHEFGAKQAIEFGRGLFTTARNARDSAKLVRSFKDLTKRQQTVALMSIRDELLNQFRGTREGAAAKITRLQEEGTLELLEELGARGKRVADAIRKVANENEKIRAIDQGSGSPTYSNIAGAEAAREIVQSPLNKAVGAFGDKTSWPMTVAGDVVLATTGLPPVLTLGKAATAAIDRFGNPSAKTLSRATEGLYGLPPKQGVNALAPPTPNAPRAPRVAGPPTTPAAPQDLGALLRQLDEAEANAKTRGGPEGAKLLKQIDAERKRLEALPAPTGKGRGTPPVKMGFGGGEIHATTKRSVNPPGDEELLRAGESLNAQQFEAWKGARDGLSNTEIADRMNEVLPDAKLTADNVKVLLSLARRNGFDSDKVRRAISPETQRVIELKAHGMSGREIAARVYPGRDPVKAMNQIHQLTAQHKSEIDALRGRSKQGFGEGAPVTDWAIPAASGTAAFAAQPEGTSVQDRLGAAGMSIIGTRMAAPAIRSGVNALKKLPRELKPPSPKTYDRAPEQMTFGGVKAKTADRKLLGIAEQMEKSGAGRNQIIKETGWFRGVDGKWKFEIDDSKAQYRGKLTEQGEIPSGPFAQPRAPLNTFLDDAGAGGAYPDLKKIRTSVNRGGGEGGYSDKLRTAPESMISYANDAPTTRSVLLHERQHAIQGREGFAGGDGVEQFPPAGYDPLAGLSPKELQSVETKAIELFGKAKTRWAQDLAPDEYPASWDVADDSTKRAIYARARYALSSGETEARNVQSRLNFTPEQRRAQPPWQTQDVPDDQQIVRYGSGKAESRGSKPPNQMGGGGGKGPPKEPSDATPLRPTAAKDGQSIHITDIRRADGSKDAFTGTVHVDPKEGVALDPNYPSNVWNDLGDSLAKKLGKVVPSNLKRMITPEGLGVFKMKTTRTTSAPNWSDANITQIGPEHAPQLDQAIRERFIGLVKSNPGARKYTLQIDPSITTGTTTKALKDLARATDHVFVEFPNEAISIVSREMYNENWGRFAHGNVRFDKPGSPPIPKQAPASTPKPPGQNGLVGAPKTKGPKLAPRVIETLNTTGRKIPPEVRDKLGKNGLLPPGQRKSAVEASGYDPSLFALAKTFMGRRLIDEGIEGAKRNLSNLPQPPNLDPLAAAERQAMSNRRAAQRSLNTAQRKGTATEAHRTRQQEALADEQEAKRKLAAGKLANISHDEVLDQVNRRLAAINRELETAPPSMPSRKPVLGAPPSGLRGQKFKGGTSAEANDTAKLLFSEEYADRLPKLLSGEVTPRPRSNDHLFLSIAATGGLAAVLGWPLTVTQAKRGATERGIANGTIPEPVEPPDPRVIDNPEANSRDQKTVEAAQFNLNLIEPRFHLRPDGVMLQKSGAETNTQKVVKRFQWEHREDYGLEVTGLLDEKTLEAISEEARKVPLSRARSARASRETAPAQ